MPLIQCSECSHTPFPPPGKKKGESLGEWLVRYWNMVREHEKKGQCILETHPFSPEAMALKEKLGLHPYIDRPLIEDEKKKLAMSKKIRNEIGHHLGEKK